MKLAFLLAVTSAAKYFDSNGMKLNSIKGHDSVAQEQSKFLSYSVQQAEEAYSFVQTSEGGVWLDV